MESRLNYVLLGVFFVFSLVALAFFVFWAGKYDRNLTQYNPYYLYHKELPKGVRKETQVRYLGIPVGFVKDYKLQGDKVEILLWVKKEIELKEGAKAIVESQGLTGGNYISLIQGDGGSFKGERAVLAFEANWIEKVGDRAQETIKKLEISLDRVNLLLNDKNLENFEKSLENFASFTTHLNSTLVHFNNEIDGFSKVRDSFSQSLERGDYNLKQMLTPLLYELEENSKNLQRILQTSNDILQNLEESPSDFFFSRQKIELGPRE
ncbi:ABC transporter permease [Helicobacter valdiviensis]|uniref:ABC transporter permease n=1 Tax=Helicobacter valdiviensis TaxID=1458358 RepID=A0A2W6NI16_9HELI|nr:MlaD family protein [Helicobacter valdiviensis]PZT48510.1 ABC transporter permease [Helicobacter valdiviensis]